MIFIPQFFIVIGVAISHISTRPFILLGYLFVREMDTIAESPETFSRRKEKILQEFSDIMMDFIASQSSHFLLLIQEGSDFSIAELLNFTDSFFERPEVLSFTRKAEREYGREIHFAQFMAYDNGEFSVIYSDNCEVNWNAVSVNPEFVQFIATLNPVPKVDFTMNWNAVSVNPESVANCPRRPTKTVKCLHPVQVSVFNVHFSSSLHTPYKFVPFQNIVNSYIRGFNCSDLSVPKISLIAGDFNMSSHQIFDVWNYHHHNPSPLGQGRKLEKFQCQCATYFSTSSYAEADHQLVHYDESAYYVCIRNATPMVGSIRNAMREALRRQAPPIVSSEQGCMTMSSPASIVYEIVPAIQIFVEPNNPSEMHFRWGLPGHPSILAALFGGILKELGGITDINLASNHLPQIQQMEIKPGTNLMFFNVL